MLVPCAKPGCSAALHNECRQLLAARVKIYWEPDRQWYWGTVNWNERDANGDLRIDYDDGTHNYEALGTVMGEEEGVEVSWLVSRSSGQLHSSMWREACSCAMGVVVDEGRPRELEEDARYCAVCCTSDYRYRSEGGDVNHLVFCDGCGMCVHMFCYGMNARGDLFGRQVRDMFGRKGIDKIKFYCDRCAFEGGPDAQCTLCLHSGGALRQRTDKKSWFHVACVQYNSTFEYPLAKQHNSSRLCLRNSNCGLCLKQAVPTSDYSAHKAKVRNRRCAFSGCKHPGHTEGLVLCGGQGPGCQLATHVSCAQQLGSGWHIKLKECEDKVGVEVLCSACSDCVLDLSGPTIRYQRTTFPELQLSVGSFVTDAEFAAAPWTFQDWAHGPCFGFTRVGHRGGGLCVGACDSDDMARTQCASF
jgi:hypothetical protein